MKSIAGYALAGFILIASGGFVASWYAQAHFMEEHTAQMLAKINENAHVSLTYSSIETKGFPTNVVVRVNNPQISAAIAPLVKPLAQLIPPSPDGSNEALLKNAILTMPDWSEFAAIDGYVELGVNIWSNAYTLRLHGPTVQTGVLNGVNYKVLGTPQGDSNCTLKTKNENLITSELWNTEKISELQDNLATHFESFSCNFSGSESVFSDSKELAYRTGPISWNVLLDKSEQHTAFSFDLNVKDLLFTEAYDKLFDTYVTTLIPNIWKTAPSNLALYKEQNIDIAISADLPNEMAALMNGAPLSIDIRHLDFNNAVYQSNTNMKANLTSNAGNYNGSFLLNSNFKADKAYERILAETVSFALEDMQNQPNADDSHIFGEELPRYSAEEWYVKIAPIIPRIHTLGQMKLLTDIDVTLNQATGDGQINVTAVELAAESYGIKGNGKSNFATETGIPTANFEISCTECLVLLDTASGYIERVHSALVNISPALEKELNYNPEEFEYAKQLLQKLASQNGASTEQQFEFSIKSTATGANVNGADIAEILQLYADISQNISENATPANTEQSAQKEDTADPPTNNNGSN